MRVAAFASWQESHAAGRRALPGSGVVGHCLVETYSVLTRLPPHRVRPELAARFLDRITTEAPPVLVAGDLRPLPRVLADAQIAGGAAYDALVATTARRHDAELLSLDPRAVAPYRVVGVRHRPIG